MSVSYWIAWTAFCAPVDHCSMHSTSPSILPYVKDPDDNMSVTQRAKLLLTLDAFGTLFTPRQPIAQQYGHVATDLGFPPIPEDELQASFRTGGLTTRHHLVFISADCVQHSSKCQKIIPTTGKRLA